MGGDRNGLPSLQWGIAIWLGALIGGWSGVFIKEADERLVMALSFTGFAVVYGIAAWGYWAGRKDALK